MNFRRNLFLPSLALLVPSAHAQYASFQYEYLGGSCHNGNMVLASESFTCNGGYCKEGDTLDAQGAVTLYGNQEFPSNYQVTIKPCMFFMYLWYICDDGVTMEMDVCDRANLQSSNSQCPAPGTYTFDFSVTIGSFFDEDSIFGSSIFLEAQIEDLDQIDSSGSSSGWTWSSGGGDESDYDEEDDVSYAVYEKCSLQFEPVQSYSYAAWQFAGAAAFFSLAGGLIFRQKRRRRQAVLGSLEEGEEQEHISNGVNNKSSNPTADFVEMSDFASASTLPSGNGAVV